METLETVQNPCKAIDMDLGLDACQIFTTLKRISTQNLDFYI